VQEGSKISAPDNREKQHEEKESQRQKEGQHEEENIGSRTRQMHEVVMWTNLIHLMLCFLVMM